MSKPLRLIAIFLFLAAAGSRADSSVGFNEIMYHPATNAAAMEWVELYNQMAVDVDISGWALDGGVTYMFASNTIVRGGGFLVVAGSPSTLMAATGLTNVLGPFTGRLSNGGEALQLRNNNGRVVDEANYGVEGDWPVAPDGSGVSLAKRDHDTASGPAANWSFSDQVGGTPGAENFPGVSSAPAQVFPVETAWKYNASGTDLGSSWRQPGYADAAWASGNAWLFAGTVTNGVTRSVATLFNTGVDAGGVALAPGAADPHFIVSAAPQGAVNTNAIVSSSNPAWVANDTHSSWISVVSSGSTSISAGGYNYLTRFSLAGFIPGSVQVLGSISVDDNLSDVLFNGASLGVACSGYATFNGPFALNGAALPGTNTLEFRTVNGGGPGAFRATLTATGTSVLTNTLLPLSPTWYLRKTFTWSGDPAATLLRLNAIVADGAIFYLNGVEVLRLNLPAGPVAFSTPAVTNVASPAYTGFLTIPADSLVNGTNVLAVEVHRAVGNTNRMLFGAEMTAQTVPASPTLVFNEVSGSTNAAFWVELMNCGADTVVLDGSVVAQAGSDTNQCVIPAGTALAPGSFLALTNGALGFQPASGDKLFLYRADKGRVYDAVVVKKTPRGRSPDGTGPWLFPSAPTPGGSNSFSFHREIVINEFMYHHRDLPPTNGVPAQDSPESWVELYNRGTTTVDLTGWSLGGGISYAFPAGQTLAADGYLVVAGNAAYLRSIHPDITILGDFGKSLSRGSDTVVLYDAAGNPANQVHYFDDGRWPLYAAGGGSSLELRDPNADNSRPEAWAASDETGRSSWQTYRYRAVAQTLVGPEQWNDFCFGLLGDGECLIDDISVVQSPTNTPVQLISNGNFESGLTGWRLLGDHRLSRVELDPDNPTNHVLHVVADGAQEHMHNHIETTYANGRSVVNGQTYEVSFRGKWLAGNNLLNTRLYFDRVAQTSVLPVPALNGTPGARNSRYTTNLGPTFSSFQHRSVVPQPGEAVTVSVVAQDPQGISGCEVWWSTNGGAFSHAAMLLQGGGLYAGSIPGYAAGTIVQFYVRATDSLGAATTYPAAGPDSGALYMVADGQADLTLGHNLRIILTPANRGLLHALTNVMSNENLPCTVVYDEQRAYYDMGVRLKGSERGRYSDTRVSFHLEFQPDDLFRGVHPVMLIDRSGAGDATVNKQEEIVIRHMLLRAGNIPGTQPDLCRVIAPYSTLTGPSILGPRHEDEFVQTAYANGGSGIEWELELIYYPTTSNQFGYKLPNPDNVVGVDISDLGTNKEIYRYDFILKNHREADDYSRLLTFARTFSLPSGSALDLETRQVMDVDEWLRAFALLSLCGVGDSYTFGNNHNLLLYLRPADQKMLAFPWDMDFAFVQSPTASLIGGQNLSKVENLPANKRRLYAHALDIINTAFNTSYMTYWVSHYMRFAPGQDYSGALSYIQQRAAGVQNEINGAGGNSAFTVNGASFINTTNNLLTLAGTAPVRVQSILINGVAYPITWTSVSAWTMSVPVNAGTNVLRLVGCDLHGNALANFSSAVTVNYTGAMPEPAGIIVINEIMFNPVVPGAAYVELFNASPSVSFDLSNWHVHGLDYTFPPGSVITNRQFLVLAKDPATFTATYGTSAWAFDAFAGNLQTNGETLTLERPDSTGTNYLTVAKVRYDSAAPWPAAKPGSSAQLVDASRDNWRAANWAVSAASPATPGAKNSTTALLDAFPTLWLNEAQAENLTGITNRLGQRTAWIELYNPGSNTIALGGLYLANNFTNLAQWGFPTNASIRPGEFKVIFADGQAGLSTTNELHAGFTLPAGAGGAALTRLATNGQLQVLDYLSYTNLGPNHSYGSLPDGQSFDRQEFYYATAGGANNGASAPLTVAINEWMPGNTQTIRNPIGGGFDDWFELYNYGTNPANLAGYFLTHELTNPFQFQIPDGYTVPPQGFLLVWADRQSSTSGGDLHVNFKLSKSGTSIGLFGADGAVVDFVTFGAQTSDVSMGRFPDGGPNISILPVATPATNNVAPNEPPVLPALPNRFVVLGQTLSFQVQATDPDHPAQTITYSLEAGAPTNASIDAASGWFTWTPAPNQSPSTNLVSVRVTDNGIPPLSASQSFTITVLSSGVAVSSRWTGSSLILDWPLGTLMRADTLAGPWTPVTNTPPLVVAPNAPQAFYRVLLQQ
jgi:hypothetical protein